MQYIERSSHHEDVTNVDMLLVCACQIIHLYLTIIYIVIRRIINSIVL